MQLFISTLIALVGVSIAAAKAPRDLVFPLRYEVGREPAESFGYEPAYTQNVPSFDSRNRPYIRSRGVDTDATAFIHTREDGRWIELDFIKAVRAVYPNYRRTIRGAGQLTERIAFDAQDRAYMFLKIQLEDDRYRNLLMMSDDSCRTWQIAEINRGGEWAMDYNTSPRPLEGPPFLIGSINRVARHPNRWASYHRFHVALPELDEGKLKVPGTQHVHDELLSIGQHSGGSSFVATRDGKTHFFWIEPTLENMPGTPTYAATYDHGTRTFGPKVLVAHAPPLNNSHNRPGVVMDSTGYLHLVTGSHHGQNFYHTRSLVPGDVHAGWTDPEPVWGSGWIATNGEEHGGQTYVSLVIDAADTLHLAFRLWREPDEHFPDAEYYAALAYQRKPRGGDWTKPRLLMVAERDLYSIYYQKLAIDRIGRLFLSFSHFNWRMDRAPEVRYQKRMVVLSDDGGDSWRLAASEDFDAVLPAPQ